MRCTVLGSGTWGTALGQVLADNGNNVTIYGIDNNEVNDININHKNSKYFGDEVILPNLITATTDLKEALKTLGTFEIEIRLYEGVIGKLKIDIISE